MKYLAIALIFASMHCFADPKCERVWTPAMYDSFCRINVPHGWLLVSDHNVYFYPDEKHEWELNK